MIASGVAWWPGGRISENALSPSPARAGRRPSPPRPRAGRGRPCRAGRPCRGRTSLRSASAQPREVRRGMGAQDRRVVGRTCGGPFRRASPGGVRAAVPPCAGRGTAHRDGRARRTRRRRDRKECAWRQAEATKWQTGGPHVTSQPHPDVRQDGRLPFAQNSESSLRALRHDKRPIRPALPREGRTLTARARLLPCARFRRATAFALTNFLTILDGQSPPRLKPSADRFASKRPYPHEISARPDQPRSPRTSSARNSAAPKNSPPSSNWSRCTPATSPAPAADASASIPPRSRT